MKNLGESISRYKNYGAKVGFGIAIGILVFFIGFFSLVKLDDFGQKMIPLIVSTFLALAVYMYFKSRTEIDIREHGLFVKNAFKSHEILYTEIAKFDKTRRVGKSGAVIIVYYLLVVVKKDGERITSPARVSEEFLAKLIETSRLDDASLTQ